MRSIHADHGERPRAAVEATTGALVDKVSHLSGLDPEAVRRDILYTPVPAIWNGSSVRRDNGTVTANLVLMRKPPLNLQEVRRGTFDVLVDGRLVGSYELHKTFEAEVEPGNHTVEVRDGRFSSRELSFQVSDGQTVSFNCHGRRISPIFLTSFIVPRWGLNLTRT